MSEESANPVVETVVKEELSPRTEDTTPAPDKQAEVEAEVVEEGSKTIPKERFDQVWARTKKAEARAQELEAERTQEREARIRLEERLAAKEAAKAAEPELTWDQLELSIEEGKITRAQANAYREQLIEKRLEKKYEAQKTQESTSSKVLGELEQYKQLIPDVMTYGSDSRKKYETKFRQMLERGLPNNYATQLAATEAAFGDIETVKSRTASRQAVTPKESFEETHTPSSGSQKSTKSFKDALPQYKVEHYEKMIKAGAHKDWKEVEALEKWTPSIGGRR
ncbi:MAG: hypothetical protein ABL983_00930 [Nitrospira sp.]